MDGSQRPPVPAHAQLRVRPGQHPTDARAAHGGELVRRQVDPEPGRFAGRDLVQDAVGDVLLDPHGVRSGLAFQLEHENRCRTGGQVHHARPAGAPRGQGLFRDLEFIVALHETPERGVRQLRAGWRGHRERLAPGLRHSVVADDGQPPFRSRGHGPDAVVRPLHLGQPPPQRLEQPERRGDAAVDLRFVRTAHAGLVRHMAQHRQHVAQEIRRGAARFFERPSLWQGPQGVGPLRILHAAGFGVPEADPLVPPVAHVGVGDLVGGRHPAGIDAIVVFAVAVDPRMERVEGRPVQQIPGPPVGLENVEAPARHERCVGVGALEFGGEGRRHLEVKPAVDGARPPGGLAAVPYPPAPADHVVAFAPAELLAAGDSGGHEPRGEIVDGTCALERIQRLCRGRPACRTEKRHGYAGTPLQIRVGFPSESSDDRAVRARVVEIVVDSVVVDAGLGGPVQIRLVPELDRVVPPALRRQRFAVAAAEVAQLRLPVGANQRQRRLIPVEIAVEDERGRGCAGHATGTQMDQAHALDAPVFDPFGIELRGMHGEEAARHLRNAVDHEVPPRHPKRCLVEITCRRHPARLSR